MADRLISISEHIAGSAEYGAATSHRLAGIANAKAAEIDDADPLSDKSMKTLQGIAILMKVANSSAETAINLLAANKDKMKSDDPNENAIVHVDRPSAACPE